MAPPEQFRILPHLGIGPPRVLPTVGGPRRLLPVAGFSSPDRPSDLGPPPRRAPPGAPTSIPAPMPRTPRKKPRDGHAAGPPSLGTSFPNRKGTAAETLLQPSAGSSRDARPSVPPSPPGPRRLGALASRAPLSASGQRSLPSHLGRRRSLMAAGGRERRGAAPRDEGTAGVESGRPPRPPPRARALAAARVDAAGGERPSVGPVPPPLPASPPRPPMSSPPPWYRPRAPARRLAAR